MELAREHPADADLVMPVPDTGAPAAAGYRRGVGHPVPRGHGPQPLHGPDVHPAVADDAPAGRDDEAQPAARGRPRPAPRRGRRFDRARGRRRSRSSRSCGGPARPRSTSGSAPRRSTTRASTASTRRSRPSSSPRPTPVDGDPRLHRRRFARLPLDRRRPRRARPAVRAVLLRLLRRPLPGARPVRRGEPQVRPRGDAGRRPVADRRMLDGDRAPARATRRRASTSPPASGRSSSCAPRSSRPAGRRCSAGSAGSAAAVAHPARLSRAGARLVDRRRRHEDGDRRRDRPLRHDRPRPRRDVRRRRRLQRRRAALLPRLRRGRAARPGARRRARRRRRRGLPRWPAVPSSAARRRSIRGSWSPTRSTSPAAASASSSATRLLDGTAVRAGDAIVGLAASRPARQRVLARPGARSPSTTSTSPAVPGAAPPDARRRRRERRSSRPSPEHALATLGEVLLTPTRIYARAVLGLRDALAARRADLRGVAHITGGGLPGNVPRALPAGPRRAARPGALADAVGHAAVRGPRRARRRRAAGDVQRRHRDGRSSCRPTAVGDALATASRRSGVPAWLVGEVAAESRRSTDRYVEAPLADAGAGR